MSETPAVVVRAVTHRYRRTLALDDVTLDIPAGCMAGLIGPDGVGKSTLLAITAGVRRLQDGTVGVLGADVRRAADRRALGGRIAYMPQGLGRNLYPTLSVEENLDFFGRLFGQGRAERAQRIDELVRATGLAPFRDRPAGKLSGGMKQKLALCSALIHDPDLLVLDEPTTGVDPLSRRQFWQLIDRIRGRRAGMSVLVATAYMEEADRFDWLAAMHAGRVIARGTPAEIRREAGRDSLEAAFVALMPDGDGAREPVVVPPRPAHDGPPAIEAEGLTCRFGDFTAVDNVSFTIGRGEIFGFLGSNGCGKSTTMKMLTGLLPATEGSARLFGQPVDAGDVEGRRRVGYMSQAFSLYEELTVHQNLALHADLFGLAREDGRTRIAALVERFDLGEVADIRPSSLPLGIRQRLQLAVAILHRPELLILDEPTSGVDPIARDDFWRTLIALSREEGVTIFLSTHFMNEAARCDRISLMHAGRVLAVGAPAEIAAARGDGDLETAFIAYLEEAGMTSDQSASDLSTSEQPAADALAPGRAAAAVKRFDPRRLWSYARREAIEILRDPRRLAFALAGPLLLMLAFGYGISFDVENIPYAVLDNDRSAQSRQLLETFQGSRYFEEREALAAPSEIGRRLQAGDIDVAIEVPSGFGRDLVRGRQPEVAVWLDGAMPSRAETIRSYVSGLASTYAADAARRVGEDPARLLPVDIDIRMRFNQAFVSTDAIVPSVIMLMLVLIPAIMTAIGVVKEKETGSIANFRATPVTRIEFLLGKQLPYIAIALVSFVAMVALALAVFQVPFTGSAATLVLGTVAYVVATTGFGLLVSSFVGSQIAAIFATAILSILPAVNFSGLLVPVSSLSGGARAIGLAFPSAWYQPITSGTFSKGLGFDALGLDILALAGFAVVYLAASAFALSKQER